MLIIHEYDVVAWTDKVYSTLSSLNGLDIVFELKCIINTETGVVHCKSNKHSFVESIKTRDRLTLRTVDHLV